MSKIKNLNKTHPLKGRIQKFRKVLALALSVGFLSTYLTPLTQGEQVVYAATVSDKEDYIKNGTILHCFSWDFNTIRENLPNIKAAGFTAIQTSPANSIVHEGKGLAKTLIPSVNDSETEGVWYYHYQPTDWKIGNWQLGSREEFKQMCEAADELGIQVLVDVVPNHTTPFLNQVSPEFVRAVGGWDKMYHGNAKVDVTLPLKINGVHNPSGSIATNDAGVSDSSEWNNPGKVTSKSLLGLPDVNTENPRFQAYFIKYLNDLVACGADGFRYDTGKHIALPHDPLDSKTAAEGQRNNFWAVVTGKESVNGVTLQDKDNLFIYGEILQGGSVDDEAYTDYVYMTANYYGNELRRNLDQNHRHDQHSNSPNLDSTYLSASDLMNWRHVNPDKIVTWVESHDTYFNEGESRHLTDQQLRLGWAAIAARAEGTPLFFSRPDGSRGWDDYDGNNVLGAKGNDEFMSLEVREVNKFRLAMVGQGEYLRDHYGAKVYQIDRGTLGTCIINVGEARQGITFPTTMAAGEYIDHVSGRRFVVEDGLVKGDLDAGKVAVIYAADFNLGASTLNKEEYFFGDAVDVRLTAVDLSNLTYETSDGASGSFQNGQVVRLRPGSDGQVRIKLKGTKSDGGEAMREFVFTRMPKYDIYFKNTDNWSTVVCYVYNGSVNNGGNEIGGERMVNLGFGVYGYNIPDMVKEVDGSTRVIIHAGGFVNQYPEGEGLVHDEHQPYLLDRPHWKRILPPLQGLPFPRIKSITPSVEGAKEGEEVVFSAEAEGGYLSDGEDYKFQFTAKPASGSAVVLKGFDENKIPRFRSPYPESVYLDVEVQDSSGVVVTKTFVYTWEPKDVVYTRDYDVYIKRPAGWSRSDMKAYAYVPNSNPSVENAGFPGVAMEYVGGDVFAYKLPDGVEGARVIFSSKFNNASVQYPSSGSEGLDVPVDASMLLDEQMTWEKVAYNPIEITSFTVSLPSPQNHGTDITLSAEARGGSGNLLYRFEQVETVDTATPSNAIYNLIQDYSAQNSVAVTSDHAGAYTYRVLVKNAEDVGGNSVVNQRLYYTWQGTPPQPQNPEVPPQPQNPEVPPQTENPEVPPQTENPEVPPQPQNPEVPPQTQNPATPSNPRERDTSDRSTGGGSRRRFTSRKVKPASKTNVLNSYGSFREGVDGNWVLLDEKTRTWTFRLYSGMLHRGWNQITRQENGMTKAAWYYFSDGMIMNSGWILDEKTHRWYYLSERDDGSFGSMQTGWYLDSASNQWYLLENESGQMQLGWQKLGDVWYYLNPTEQSGDNAVQTRPLGAMYQNERTPDGYFVDANGAWVVGN